MDNGTGAITILDECSLSLWCALQFYVCISCVITWVIRLLNICVAEAVPVSTQTQSSGFTSTCLTSDLKKLKNPSEVWWFSGGTHYVGLIWNTAHINLGVLFGLEISSLPDRNIWNYQKAISNYFTRLLECAPHTCSSQTACKYERVWRKSPQWSHRLIFMGVWVQHERALFFIC